MSDEKKVETREHISVIFIGGPYDGDTYRFAKAYPVFKWPYSTKSEYGWAIYDREALPKQSDEPITYLFRKKVVAGQIAGPSYWCDLEFDVGK